MGYRILKNGDKMKSYMAHLECTYCRQTYSFDKVRTVCTACGKVLYARYDLEQVRADIGRLKP